MTRAGPQRFWFAAGLFLLAAGTLLPAESRANDTDVVRPTTVFSKPETYEALPAGALTSQKRVNAHAFSQPSTNMAFSRQLDFQVGDGFFRRLWVSAPASTKLSDGLGPHYNARACQRCHLKDGRGHPPKAMFPADNAISMLIRLSIPARTPDERRLIVSGRAAVIPEPVYGGQLQDFAIQGHRAEGRIAISYTNRTVTLRGGKTVTLQKPTYRIVQPA
jgi:CxxC motif-containing protein (DUF1111 family)